ncbi:hypothetical protein [uncultured Desulfosarcina sp.]|uniref:hypothetical protein n=1 Tax=uncultured Desulfosarcina sp. TaxID=218289 RepID=UPI0029C70459|nr:hypothetical protein [uncultured Desulfosarcina sp.]
MADSNPTLWNTTMGSIRRTNLTRFEKLKGNTPCVTYDPNLMKVSHVVVRDLVIRAEHMTLKEAEANRYVAVEPYGFQECVFLLRNSIEVVIVPSTEAAQALCS